VWVLGVALLVGLPLAVRAIPATDADVSARDLLGLVRASADEPWSGQAESKGTLQLPEAGRFNGVAALLGEGTRMRGWWRSDQTWRVDRLGLTGENDLIHRDGVTVEWDYEDDEVQVSTDPLVRLPRSSDLLPPVLGRRVVTGEVDVTRADPRRVAGVDAAGLRVEPSTAASSIDHVLLWADPDTGVVLRVEVYDGASSRVPVFTSAFSRYDAGQPDGGTTRFTPPAGAELRTEDVLDIADAADQYADVPAPRTLAGLRDVRDLSGREARGRGAVGVYGEGLTQLIAIPLRDQEGRPLERELGTTFGSREVALGPSPVPDLPDEVARRLETTVVALGPLGVALTQNEFGYWLLAGAVTRPTLLTAAEDLRADVAAGFGLTSGSTQEDTP